MSKEMVEWLEQRVGVDSKGKRTTINISIRTTTKEAIEMSRFVYTKLCCIFEGSMDKVPTEEHLLKEFCAIHCAKIVLVIKNGEEDV